MSGAASGSPLVVPTSAWSSRANLRLGTKVLKDANRPLTKRFATRALRRSHVRRAKAALRLRDGRLVRLSQRFRVCARR